MNRHFSGYKNIDDQFNLNDNNINNNKNNQIPFELLENELDLKPVIYNIKKKSLKKFSFKEILN